MATIHFIDFEGNRTTINADNESSVMQAAVQNDVPGIDADCGGACACATCHVYVHEDWLERVGKPNEIESEMLDVADKVEANSRLACQISINETLDGLIVTTPESQF